MDSETFYKVGKKYMLIKESDPRLTIPDPPLEQPAELFWSDESNYDDNIHGPSMWEEKISKNFMYVLSHLFIRFFTLK